MTSQFTNIEYFQEFTDHPRCSDKKTILGSIQYIEHSIVGKEQGPKNSTLIHIFNQFTVDEVKDYVYARMTKAVLLELALAILKEIATGGPKRAHTLQLTLKRTAAGGKEV